MNTLAKAERTDAGSSDFGSLADIVAACAEVVAQRLLQINEEAK